MKIDLSVIIVNYNGKEYADKCINSVFFSKSNNLEIILVDNGSLDGSIEYLKNKYLSFGNRFIRVSLEKNYGPALARNKGVERANGKYLCFLDNDTEVEENWANIAITEFEKDDCLGVVQCKLILSKERSKLDYVGEYLGQNGFLVQRAQAGEIDNGQHDEKVKILAAKSAGMFIRHSVFKKINGFDSDYFIYVEETDLGWRSWLAGYETRFISDSIVYHEFGTSTVILGKDKNNYNAKFHGCKNYILTLFKNLDSYNLFKILPLHIALWLGLAWYALILKWDGKAFWWIHKGVFWNLINLKINLRKRRIIQENRIINDKDLFKIILKKKPFMYFVHKVTGVHKVGNAEGFIKSK
jgi:GT2 family glycosyltransferase